jgi:glycosyltransferase involved in cell wall biosynthesis
VSKVVLIPADVRFPLERANGVQIVKTAAALARAGARPTLLVRRSDPRPTAEILALYGERPDPWLTVRRAFVFHRPGRFAVPRAVFLARATAAACAATARGAAVFTRDLQLADLLLRLGRRPLLYEAHAVESLMYGERARLYGNDERPDPAKARRLAGREARVWRDADGLVTTTAGIRDSLAEAYGARGHVRVVPNGCDVPEGPCPAPSAEHPPRVVYAGQLYPWKGVDLLVEAMAAVPGARLVVLGGLSGEPDLGRIRARVAGLGLSERAELPGSVPQAQVAGELRRAAVIVVPFLRSRMTERHTSPLKAFEAMAAGRPIVISDLPSTREVLRHEETALLVPPGDADALADAIRRLLADAALARRLAGAAFVEARRYSWDTRARAILSLIREVA